MPIDIALTALAMPITEFPAIAREAEARGYRTAWVGEASGAEAIRALDPGRYPYRDPPDRQRGDPRADPHAHRVRPGGGDPRASGSRPVRARARAVERDHRRPVARPAVHAVDPADAGGRPDHPAD